MSDVYGTRVSGLPKEIQKQIKSARGGDIRLLSWEEYSAAEAATLRRFKGIQGDSVDWDEADVKDWTEYDDDPDIVQAISSLIQRRAKRSKEVIFFWDLLGVPSIGVPISSLENYVEQIVNESFRLWFYLPDDGYFCDISSDGHIIGGLPPGAEDSQSKS